MNVCSMEHLCLSAIQNWAGGRLFVFKMLAVVLISIGRPIFPPDSVFVFNLLLKPEQ